MINCIDYLLAHCLKPVITIWDLMLGFEITTYNLRSPTRNILLCFLKFEITPWYLFGLVCVHRNVLSSDMSLVYTSAKKSYKKEKKTPSPLEKFDDEIIHCLKLNLKFPGRTSNGNVENAAQMTFCNLTTSRIESVFNQICYFWRQSMKFSFSRKYAFKILVSEMKIFFKRCLTNKTKLSSQIYETTFFTIWGFHNCFINPDSICRGGG